ncbi:hypothetical protein Kisp01_71340 [Kineosporia sp. NBRC 101677]|nr:hypothetical protein Kisp01_71340 [Kineosporia sp. NBRC 101677]
MDFGNRLYLEQSATSDDPGPLLGTATDHICNDTGREEAPSSTTKFDAHELAGVDPQYAILVVHEDASGAKESSGTVFAVPEEEMPAEVWADIQALAK